ncbi:hypothetical protein CROQUDRAFT_679578 [Cronartium quercuum f. sp. fusiforme G11]|uniref:Uncharacterized protein n=1 Tax=Cronartium quercuum f. sp. fusiforme G11 TaxID=708437 RepID=A0A9P6TA14_9BASI|nr:hypothetical protein CROQUDRAFT_679578 [Cronartium quercuum f. sp. fusiforme G11]
MKLFNSRLRLILFAIVELRLVQCTPLEPLAAVSDIGHAAGAAAKPVSGEVTAGVHLATEGGGGSSHLHPATISDFRTESKVPEPTSGHQPVVPDRNPHQKPVKPETVPDSKPEVAQSSTEPNQPHDSPMKSMNDWKNEKNRQLDELVKEYQDHKFSGDEILLTRSHYEIVTLGVQATQHEISALGSLTSGNIEEASIQMQLAKEKWSEHFQIYENLIKQGGEKFDLKEYPDFAKTQIQRAELETSISHPELFKEASIQQEKFSQQLNDAEIHRNAINKQILNAAGDKPKALKSQVEIEEKNKLIEYATSALKWEQEAISRYQQANYKGATKAFKNAKDFREKFLQKTIKYVEKTKGRVDVLENFKYQRNLAILNNSKGNTATSLIGPNVDKLSHGLEKDAATKRSWVLPLLHPDGKGDPKSTVASWNKLPWDTKYIGIQRVTTRGNKPTILEEKLARDAIFERFNELHAKIDVNPASVSRQEWFNLQIASRDLKKIEDKRAKELAKLRRGFLGKAFHLIGHVFWPIKFTWRMLRAAGRRTAYWLLERTDPAALTPETRLKLYDRNREITWLGTGARALGGNPAGWIGRLQPQGNAAGVVGRGWRPVKLTNGGKASEASQVAGKASEGSQVAGKASESSKVAPA